MKTKNKIILSLIGIFIISISLIINNSYQKYSYSAPTIIKDDNNETIIAAYIDGELSTSFPTTKKFRTSVECFDKNGETLDVDAGVTWDSTNTKWVANFTGITNGTTRCNVYFEDNSQPKGWKTATATSLLGAIKNSAKDNTQLSNGDTDANYVTMTIPGQQRTTVIEGLRAAEDDYGTSYYYRGAVTNNYVKFADMCWRIVRIDGNGNIKLVLYNYQKEDARETINASKKSNPCDTAYDSSNVAFARYSGDAYTSAFNTNSYKNAYVGLKYGTPGSSTYEAEHNGNNLSTILTNLNTWYAANLNDVDSKIASVSYCNDKTPASSMYNPDNWSDAIINKGYGQIKTNYSARERLYDVNSAAPVLTCSNEISRVENKIGLLSVDEVAYAGAIYATSNSQFFLYKNASGFKWWTSSPSRYRDDIDVWILHTNGSLTTENVIKAFGLRPAIALKPDLAVSYLEDGEGNPGTSTNPFVIE